jgi:hypothetical protein
MVSSLVGIIVGKGVSGSVADWRNLLLSEIVVISFTGRWLLYDDSDDWE